MRCWINKTEYCMFKMQTEANKGILIDFPPVLL